ncbi:hypothetical protein HY995_00695 [Candidatus Micrarchaeota archaeon]|nr:hypothetical protein [Candidatus Micrarchaeota archaeon]MBI5176585.1 hypothetical protein [Candidatus Micrarchaeota archaeon]
MERKFAVSAAFIVLLAIAAYWLGRDSAGSLSPWYSPVVEPGEVSAALWVDANVESRQVFSGDLFNCEMLTAVSRQYCSVGGAWELADRPNERFSKNERMFLTNSSSQAWQLARDYGVQFVFTSGRQGFYAYGWKPPENGKFGDVNYFRKVYDRSGTEIYRVLGEGEIPKPMLNATV